MNVRGGVRLRLRLGQLSHLRAAQFWYNSDTAPTRTHGILNGTPKQILRIPGYRHFSNSRLKMSDPQKWTASVVRKTFLEFFEKKGHTIGRWRGNFGGEE
jgi:hypothetical protein